MADVPVEVNYGTVVGRFVSYLADTSDVGTRPDIQYLQGTITLRPTVGTIRFPGIVDPQLAAVSSIACTINTDGYLQGPDPSFPGVRIISTDQPSGNPTSFQWVATFNFQGFASNEQPLPVTFDLPPDSIVDLVQVIPSTPSPGTVIALADPSNYWKRWVGTQEDLDLIVPRDSGTLYAVVEELP